MGGNDMQGLIDAANERINPWLRHRATCDHCATALAPWENGCAAGQPLARTAIDAARALPPSWKFTDWNECRLLVAAKLAGGEG